MIRLSFSSHSWFPVGTKAGSGCTWPWGCRLPAPPPTSVCGPRDASNHVVFLLETPQVASLLIQRHQRASQAQKALGDAAPGCLVSPWHSRRARALASLPFSSLLCRSRQVHSHLGASAPAPPSAWTTLTSDTCPSPCATPFHPRGDAPSGRVIHNEARGRHALQTL